MDILLISPETLKTNTALRNDIDSGLLVNYIVLAQDIYIQETLGTDLFKRLISDIENETVTGIYKTLLDEYVIKALIHCSFYEVIPFVAYKFGNKGFVKGFVEGSGIEVELEEVNYIREKVVKRAMDSYLQRLSNYLKANYGKFPEYTTNTTLDKVRPKSPSVMAGIYVGNASRLSDNYFNNKIIYTNENE